MKFFSLRIVAFLRSVLFLTIVLLNFNKFVVHFISTLT